MAEILEAKGEGLALALSLLHAGELVAIPTETVYGLAADATNGVAVARVYEAKGRPSFNPLICHVDGLAMAETLGVFDPLSRQLAKAFWPGPLTLVVPLAQHSPVASLATAGLGSVGLRCPKGPAGDLIALLGRPLAAPSANSSGGISPTNASAVNADIGAKLKLILDGGQCAVGVESTIVKVEDGRFILLRPGGVEAESIEAVLGKPVVRADQRAAIEAPGMLQSHYAPRAAVRLNARELWAGEALLGFGPYRAQGNIKAAAYLNLSESGDLKEAAANLFSSLSALDESGARMIAVEPIPVHGLGEAINDRLKRAAAPRGE